MAISHGQPCREIIESRTTLGTNCPRPAGAHVAETSFYPALERLLTEIGKQLSPKVRCVIHLANRGAGLPDGGLFSADQFRRKSRGADANGNPFLIQNPSRGVIEAKPPADDLRRVAASEQVERYWKRYGMVLVTNFRAFALIGKDPAKTPTALGRTGRGSRFRNRRMRCSPPPHLAGR
jgi:hypothetical protein